jgi:hypothetical protein
VAEQRSRTLTLNVQENGDALNQLRLKLGGVIYRAFTPVRRVNPPLSSALAAWPSLRSFATKLLLGALPLVSACNYCSSYIRPEHFAGIVVGKYVDRFNRHNHIVSIQAGDQQYFLETLYGDTLNFYTRIAIGDSVIKAQWTTAYRVKNAHKDAVYEFNCP